MSESEPAIGVTIGFVSPQKLVFVTKDRLNFGDMISVRDTIGGKDRHIIAVVRDMVFSDLQSIGDRSQALGTPRSELYSIVSHLLGDELKTFITVECDVIGYVDDGSIRIVNTIIPPGLEVRLPPSTLLYEVVNIRTKYPIPIGTMASRQDVEVRLAGDELMCLTLVVGSTGSGKTHLTSLIEQKASLVGIKTIRLDLVGPSPEPLYRGRSSRYLEISDVKLDFTTLSEADICAFIDASELERFNLSEISKSEGKPSTLSALMRRVEEKVAHPAVAARFLAKLRSLHNSGLFPEDGATDLRRILLSEDPVALDLSPFASKLQDALASYLLQDIVRLHIETKNYLRTGLLIILDPVDNLLSKYRPTKTSQTLEATSRQTRKYNMGIIATHQSPSLIPDMILQIVSNLFVFRLRSECDFEIVQRIVGSKLSSPLTRMPPGELLIHVPTIGLPLTVKVEV